MKKLLLSILCISAFGITKGQNSIPNGGFENWNTINFEYPSEFVSNSAGQSYFRCQAVNIVKTTDAYNGAFAVQLTTTSYATDTCESYMVNAITTDGDPNNWQGGVPYTEQPLGIRGYYKYNVSTGDSAIIIVVCKKNGVAIGTYFAAFGGLQTSYVPFSVTFSPPLTQPVDSIIFAVASSNLMNDIAVPGSELKLDSVSFTGVASQPAMFNGDFELWSNAAVESPANWYTQDSEGRGVDKTTDAAGGSFAVELTTYEGDNNGIPRAQAGYIANASWNQGCNCYIGGYPYAQQIDTLVFTYKYSPAVVGDSAVVNVGFKNNGINFMWQAYYVPAAANYTTVEFPFNLGTMPDTVFVSAQSTAWEDSTMDRVGSVFKIDDIHMKSQSTIGLKESLFNSLNAISIYPNPICNQATIEMNSNLIAKDAELNIFDISGRLVRSLIIDDKKTTFQKADLSSGIYIFKLQKGNKLLQTGKINID